MTDEAHSVVYGFLWYIYYGKVIIGAYLPREGSLVHFMIVIIMCSDALRSWIVGEGWWTVVRWPTKPSVEIREEVASYL